MITGGVSMNKKQMFFEKLIERLNQGWSISLAKQKAKKDAQITMTEANSFIDEFEELQVLLRGVSLDRKEERRFFHRRGHRGY